mmetsp:Transcript_58855/g.140375  ORF Transcript_58855/g.140375 Transcript_58855/m.140375 type:complete len:444 (-) Transcript_58855:251-1582(-)|eukprot:CAMPEP_0178386156 /NCGR_PEP_ID=MMETSP0689_2-20121128/8409_1 /TAXON_ID=160604 /ORGANISM="Amphidinium massartii, Strain CS-259" /LENGTH=443 /DNA_ID=CAMNT_0020006473 /DNA_START=88 /DNA_END=1419 /DNA_ORIENTATION=+
MEERSGATPLAPKDPPQAFYDSAELQTPRVSEHRGTASSRAITLNLITGGLGSAIFSLPWSVAGSSIVPSVFIIGFVLALNAWTIGILVRAAEEYQEFDVGSLLSKLPGILGRRLQLITNVLVWTSMFLCLVSYMIVIHDSAIRFLHGTRLEARPLLVTVASVLVLPLCFLNQSRLESTSSVAIIINIYLFVLVGVLFAKSRAHGELPESTCLIGSTIRGEFAATSVMFQAVIIQMCVLPMYKELENRSPKKMDRIVAVGFGSLFFIFCGFAILGYLYVGPQVDSNILTNLPRGPWADAAQIGTILVVACVYPIMLYPMIAPLEELQSQARSVALDAGSSDGHFRRKCFSVLLPLAKVAIVAAVAIVAVFVDSLGFVNTVNGAMSAGVFVAIIPSLVGMCLLDGKALQKVALMVLLVVGLSLAALGLAFTQNYVSDLHCRVYA